MIAARSETPDSVRVGVDVGGTFTDAVVLVAGRLTTAKVPTTPADQSEGVIAALLAALAAAGVGPERVTTFAHGMTVGTNALLEGAGAPTGLVATTGFADVLELRRQDRADLYRLDRHHPPALVSLENTVEARERCGPEGVIVPLSSEALDAVVTAVEASGVRSIAVGLLFSFAHPDHERRIAAALRARIPSIHVSASSDVLPEMREYERIATTVVDAYLTPILAAYLGRLGERCRAAALPQPAIMLSNGGVLPLADAARHAAWTVLSGPAGGVIGAGASAGGAGAERLLTFDMGGTSCDVALIDAGEPARTAGSRVAGQPIGLPMLDIETVSAGGGSIAWADSGGALRVGPRSAGAVPGPAAYGHGGREPTVTDANVVLGRLDPATLLGGAIRLRPDLAAAAVAGLAGALDLEARDCAEGIVRVAVQEMVRALRLVSVERGIDPRSAALVAFGGAGPLHACQIAEELAMSRVVVPAAPGMLAAFGLTVAAERRDYVQTALVMADDRPALMGHLDALLARAERELPAATLTAAVDCRYAGQSFSLTVAWDPATDPDPIAAFHAAHAQRYGDSDTERAVEAVSVRLAAERPAPGAGLADVRAAGDDLGAGPLTLPLDGATAWIAPGWRARRDSSGAVVIER